MCFGDGLFRIMTIYFEYGSIAYNINVLKANRVSTHPSVVLYVSDS